MRVVKLVNTSLLLPEVKKRITISVSNDISTDQRVQKQCRALQNEGYEIALYGRLLPNSKPVSRPYFMKRFKLLFNKGFLFYAALNTKLFFTLLFAKTDIYYANDLDTLPANYLASLLRRKPLIYDSHEYFTEVPEIQNKPLVKSIWKFAERVCIGRCAIVMTVSGSIAELLQETYGLEKVFLVRNLPYEKINIQPYSKGEIGIDQNQFLVVLQGAGINVDRGAEELVEAMALVKNTTLLIIGDGDALPLLKKMVGEMSLTETVIFKPKMPFDEMMRHTAAADLGVSLDKNTNLNYRFSLPNKIFDYALAEVPVLASDLVEVKKLILEFKIGEVLPEHSAKAIAQKLMELQADRSRLAEYKKNTKRLIESLNWQTEYKPVLEKMKTLG
ncbi:glycosyltransferase [Cryomorpha ignava]|nr:glycosyltransferase [Cryomorpha ignava]